MSFWNAESKLEPDLGMGRGAELSGCYGNECVDVFICCVVSKCLRYAYKALLNKTATSVSRLMTDVGGPAGTYHLIKPYLW